MRVVPVWHRQEILALVLSVSILVLAGCGSPAFTYVTNSADRTYVKLPTTWHPIDQRQLDDALSLDPAVAVDDRGLWTVGYDADSAPSPRHLFGQQAAVPAAFVSVQDIPPSSRGQFSLDRLRDLVYPVTPSARRQEAADPSSALSDFALLGDEVLTPGGGLRGVHVVFRYRVAGGPLQIIDQTGYLNDDASKLYVFFVRCSTECYKDRQQEIQSAVSSFTVREKP